MTDPARIETQAAQLRRAASRLRSQADQLIKLAAEIDGDEQRPTADVEGMATRVRPGRSRGMGYRIDTFGAGDRAKLEALEVVVTERSLELQRGPCKRAAYRAAVADLAIISRGSMLARYVSGDGRSPEEAIAAYADALRGHRVAHGAGDARREYDVPNDFEWPVEATREEQT